MIHDFLIVLSEVLQSEHKLLFGSIRLLVFANVVYKFEVNVTLNSRESLKQTSLLILLIANHKQCGHRNEADNSECSYSLRSSSHIYLSLLL